MIIILEINEELRGTGVFMLAACDRHGTLLGRKFLASFFIGELVAFKFSGRRVPQLEQRNLKSLDEKSFHRKTPLQHNLQNSCKRLATLLQEAPT